ncbi:MAG: transcriptional regulator [Saprospiraceae bacterium]|nr:transcriptional regulator [Bacteroidia bacterium]NNE16726.1 transcriptional regulator [Saprospiraceae bacterium]NNL93478.1 transcriptional regulator [Saprospiraceae bacterium]
MKAILTGDIVNSREEHPHIWMPALKEILNQFGETPKVWEIFRGDMFQLQISAKESLTAALKIKARIRMLNNLDVRISIGIGKVEYQGTSISESNGEAFILSGECFEQLKRKKLAIKTPWQEFNEEWNLYLKLASLTTDNWAPKTAETFLTAINKPDSTQKEISNILNITQSTVSENLKRSGYYQFEDMINRFIHKINNLEVQC